MEEKFQIPEAANDNRSEGVERITDQVESLVREYEHELVKQKTLLDRLKSLDNGNVSVDPLVKRIIEKAEGELSESIHTLGDINQAIRSYMDDLFHIDQARFDTLVPVLEGIKIYLYQPLDNHLSEMHRVYAERRLKNFMSKYETAQYAQNEALFNQVTATSSEITNEDVRQMGIMLTQAEIQRKIKDEVKALLTRVGKYNPMVESALRELVVVSGVMDIESKVELELDQMISRRYLSYQKIIQILDDMRMEPVVDIDRRTRLEIDRDDQLTALARLLKELLAISPKKTLFWTEQMERDFGLTFDLN